MKNILLLCIGLLFSLSMGSLSAYANNSQTTHPHCQSAMLHSFAVADYLWEEEQKKILEKNPDISAIAKSRQIAALSRRYNCYISTVCWALSGPQQQQKILPGECRIPQAANTEPLYTTAEEAYQTLEIEYNTCYTLDQNTEKSQIYTLCEDFKNRKKKYSFTTLGNSFSHQLSLEVQGIFAAKLLDFTKRLQTLHQKVGRFTTLFNDTIRHINCTEPNVK